MKFVIMVGHIPIKGVCS